MRKMIMLRFYMSLMLITGCEFNFNSDEKHSHSAEVEETSKTSDADVITTGGSLSPQLTSIRIGVRNYDQIMQALTQITGIPADHQDIQRIFNQVANNLATESAPSKFSASHQSSIYKLAAEYCRVAASDDEYQVAVYGDTYDKIDTLVTLSGREALAEALLKNLWPNKERTLSVISEFKPILVTLAGELDEEFKVYKPKGRDNERRLALLVGTCTAALASAPVALYE